MKYQQTQSVKSLLIGLTTISLLLTIASFFMSAWIAVIGGILLFLSLAFWYWFYSIAFFKPKSQYFYVRFNRVSSGDEMSYALKNIGYILAHNFQNSLFSICILNKKQALPILIAPSSFSPEEIVSVIKNSSDFKNVEIHLDKIKQIPSELKGTFLYTYLNESLINKDTPEINLFDIFQDTKEIKSVYINCFYSKRYKEFMGSLVFVSTKAKSEAKTSMEIVSEHLPLVEAIDPSHSNPFNRLLFPMTKTLILLQLGNAVIETTETIKFKPIENPPYKKSSPLSPFSSSTTEWITAVCGADLKSPIKMQERSLVFQDFPGLSNPATIWASTFVRNKSPIIFIDFDGNASTSIKALNSKNIMDDELIVIKLPDKSPNRLVNLLSVWDGISESYYFSTLGLVLRNIEDFVRYTIIELNKNEQDRIIAILQGAVLLIALQKRPFDLASLIRSINDLSTPATFLGSVHKVLNEVIYHSKGLDETSLIWTIITQLKTTVDYSKTIAFISPDKNMKMNIEDLNTIKLKMLPFSNDSSNIILSNSDSNYNLLDVNSILFDMSEWTSTQKSITFAPEYVITGAIFLQNLRDFLGLPEAHIIINGTSRLSPVYQSRVLNLLKLKLAKYESAGNIIISDKKPLNGYVDMFTANLIDDVYFLRMNDLGQFREILSPIKGLAESIFLLKRQEGYLLRNDRKSQKKSITNFFTAQPKINIEKNEI